MRQRKQHPNKEARRENKMARRIAKLYSKPVKYFGLWPRISYGGVKKTKYAAYNKAMPLAMRRNIALKAQGKVNEFIKSATTLTVSQEELYMLP